MLYSARAPGTCGEWIQGWWQGEPALVSCPIDFYSRTSVIGNSPDWRIEPVDRKKSLLGAQHTVAIFQGTNDTRDAKKRSYAIKIENSLPESRGYASSTADIAATILAVATAMHRSLSPQEIGRICCSIEPSDSVMFAGLTLFAYRSGNWDRYLGSIVSIPILILDPQEDCDTIEFNRMLDLTKVAFLEGSTTEALSLLLSGIQQGDIRQMGRAAQMSAKAYQTIRFSALVEAAMSWAKQLNAAGLVRAHSGTIIGLLFKSDDEAAAAKNWLSIRFRGQMYVTTTINGGVVLDHTICD